MKKELEKPVLNRQESIKGNAFEGKNSHNSDIRSLQMKLFLEESQRKEALKKNLEEKRMTLKTLQKEISISIFQFCFILN